MTEITDELRLRTVCCEPVAHPRDAAHGWAVRAWFVADWRRVTFVHYAIDPAVLQPHVPFPLDLFEGRAYVSVVAFTQAGLRPAVGGAVAPWLMAPVATHAFLNLRTYVVVDGRPGIYFLAEWIANRLSSAIGPRLYGLPLRMARIRYAEDGGVVTGDGGAYRFVRTVEDGPRFEAQRGSLEAFLIERYTAFTHRNGVGRSFHIAHEPWRLRRARVDVADDGLVARAVPWFRAAWLAGAHVSDGVFGVEIGGPAKVGTTRAGTTKWVPLVALVAAALASRAWLPAWAFMWALAYAMYFGCKWATFRDAGVAVRGTPLWQRLGYLLLWPGMDARAFLGRRRRGGEEPDAAELSAATIKTLGGLTLLYLGSPLLGDVTPLLAGWLAMIGLVLALHFGFFGLLSIAWRSVGVDARPLMNAPLQSKTLGEFWGARWNRGFRDLSHRYLFRPLLDRVGPVWATLGTFAVSGLIHDLVISLPAGGGCGLPTLYFVIQGLGLLVEKTRFGRRHLRGAAGRAFAVAVTTLPAPLLFHPPFVQRVILPFVRAIGAGLG